MEFQHLSFVEKLPYQSKNVLHSHWLYTIQLSEKIDRNLILEKLSECGIETRPVFYPLHQMPPYKKFKTSKSLEISNSFSRNSLSFPSFEALKEFEIKYITKEFINISKNLYEK